MTGIRIVIDEDMKFAGDFDLPGVGKGSAVSLFLHASIFYLAALVSHTQKKSDIKLTEISLVEQVIPIPEEAPPPLPAAPPKDKNVWDFLKQVVPIKAKQDLASKMPMDLPKKPDQPLLSAMPDALKLGNKADLNKPAINAPLDLVGKKAVNMAGMNVNPLNMNKKTDSLAQNTNLPSGISLGKKSSWLPQAQAPIVGAQGFERRANLQARGGSLADMPAIQKPTDKKAAFDTSALKIERTGNTFKIFGVLQNRTILEKYLPRYPRWAEEQGLECSVSIHFFVYPSGEVKDNMQVEQGSGYSEMDQLAAKALSSFKFASLSSGEKQEEQEGVIVFYFRLSR